MAKTLATFMKHQATKLGLTVAVYRSDHARNKRLPKRYGLTGSTTVAVYGSQTHIYNLRSLLEKHVGHDQLRIVYEDLKHCEWLVADEPGDEVVGVRRDQP